MPTRNFGSSAKDETGVSRKPDLVRWGAEYLGNRTMLPKLSVVPGHLGHPAPGAFGFFSIERRMEVDVRVSERTLGRSHRGTGRLGSRGIRPNLNPIRWVMKGGAMRLNFWRAGLPGPKGHATSRFPWFRIHSSNVPYENSITQMILGSRLQWPRGREFIKGFFGQRIIGPL